MLIPSCLLSIFFHFFGGLLVNISKILSFFIQNLLRSSLLRYFQSVTLLVMKGCVDIWPIFLFVYFVAPIISKSSRSQPDGFDKLLDKRRFSGKQLRQFQFTTVGFFSQLLSSDEFISKVKSWISNRAAWDNLFRLWDMAVLKEVSTSCCFVNLWMSRVPLSYLFVFLSKFSR